MKSFLQITCLLTLIISSSQALGQKREAGTIYGRVTDLLGTPIQGAKVHIFEYQDSEMKLLQGVITDEKGNYQMIDLQPAAYKIEINFTGFIQAQIYPIHLAEREKHLLDVGLQVGQITSLPPTEIVGIVRLSDKSTLQDVTVTVISAFNQQVAKQVRTDSVGKYQVNSLTPGQYVVFASKPGLAVSATSVTLKLGDHNTADFRLVPRH